MTTSRITDEAVKAAERAMRGHDCHPVVNANIPHLARAALEAAEPLLGPRSLLDRAAVDAALIANADSLTRQGDAVMELARPMPTREQVAESLARVIHERQQQMIDGHIEDDADALAAAVLALLNGGTS